MYFFILKYKKWIFGVLITIIDYVILIFAYYSSTGLLFWLYLHRPTELRLVFLLHLFNHTVFALGYFKQWSWFVTLCLFRYSCIQHHWFIVWLIHMKSYFWLHFNWWGRPRLVHIWLTKYFWHMLSLAFFTRKQKQNCFVVLKCVIFLIGL